MRMQTSKPKKPKLKLDEDDIDEELEKFLGIVDIGEDEEENQKAKRPNTKARQRLDRGKKPISVREPRDSSIVEGLKEEWDCVTLRVERVPYDPYVKPKLIDTEKGATFVATSIVGEVRNYGMIMSKGKVSSSFSEKTKTLSAYEYLCEHESEHQSKAIVDKLQFLFQTPILANEHVEVYKILKSYFGAIEKAKSDKNILNSALNNIKQKYNKMINDKFPANKYPHIYKGIGSTDSTAMAFMKKIEKLLLVENERQYYKDYIEDIENDLADGSKFIYPKLRYPEWLHSIANSLGGCLSTWNGAAGSYAANTQMAVVENAIANQPGIGIEVKTYTKSNTRIAEWYEYKVIAYDESGNKRNEITFLIDARRDWYDANDYDMDNKRIQKFLADTKEIRDKVDIPFFQLPEVVQVHLVNPDKNNVLKDLSPGPIFLTAQTHDNHVFSHYDNRHVFSHHVQSGYLDYKAYRERMAQKYPFHSEYIMALIQKGDLLDIRIPSVTDCLGNNALHYACLHGRDISELLKLHPELNVPNAEGLYPLHLLIQHYAKKEKLPDNAAQNIEILILQKQASLFSKDVEGRSILHLAAQANDAKLFTLISMLFFNLYKDRSPEQYNIYRELFFRPDKNGNTFVHTAAQYGNVELFKQFNKWFESIFSIRLLNHLVVGIAGFNDAENFFWTPNKNGDTPLHIAAKFNAKVIIDEILKRPELKSTSDDEIDSGYGSDDNSSDDNNLVDKQNKQGNTALHLAYMFEDKKAYHALSTSAEPTILNKAGVSVMTLQLAAETAEKNKTKLNNKISYSDGTGINLDYLYQTEEINALLRIFPKKDSKGNPIYCLDAYGNLDRNIGQEALSQLIKKHQPPMTIVIPYNEGNAHWVGIVVRIEGVNKGTIQYIDSLQRPDAFNNSPIKGDLEKIFGKLKSDPTLNLLKQEDYKACGAYTVENLMLAIGGHTVIPSTMSNVNATSIRQKHIKDLEKLMPSFAKKQWDDIPIPSHYNTFAKHQSPHQYSEHEKKQITQIQEIIGQLRKLDKQFNDEIQVIYDRLQAGLQVQLYDHGPTYKLYRNAIAGLAERLDSKNLLLLQQLCGLLFQDGTAAFRQYSQKLSYDGKFIEDGIKIFEAVAGVKAQSNQSSDLFSSSSFTSSLVDQVIEGQFKNKINLDYEYQTDEINQLLAGLPKQNNDKPATPIFYLNAFGNLDGRLLRTALQDITVKQRLVAPKKIALAYNEGNAHWVGITIEFDKDSNITVNYIDSLSRSGTIHPYAKSDIEAILGKNINYQKIDLLKQDDTKACGAYTIENLKLALNTHPSNLETSKKKTTPQIREMHIIELGATFAKKQLENKMIAPISETLKYHQSDFRYSEEELEKINNLVKLINQLKLVDKKFALAMDTFFEIFRQTRNDQTSDSKIICDALKCALENAALENQFKENISPLTEQLFSLLFKKGKDTYKTLTAQLKIDDAFISDIFKIMERVVMQPFPDQNKTSPTLSSKDKIDSKSSKMDVDTVKTDVNKSQPEVTQTPTNSTAPRSVARK